MGGKFTNTRVSYELRDRPRSPWSLCGSVAEHLKVESEGLRCNSSWGLRIFFRCPMLVTKRKKKSFSIFKRNHNFFSVFGLLKRSIVLTWTLSTSCYWKFIYIISNPVYRFSIYRPHAFISGITEKHREVITKGLKFS